VTAPLKRRRQRMVSRADMRVVNISNAARYAGVSRWTIRRWINEGKLPFVRYPSGSDDTQFRADRVDLNDLDALIERSKDREEIDAAKNSPAV